MNLDTALRQISEHGRLDPEQLIAFAAEDEITGCEDGIFSPISVSRDEGRILYALVRALRPVFAVEVGCHSGCSTMHILTAMERNGIGHLHSIDPNGIQEPGVPESLQHRWSLEKIDARFYAWPVQVDFVFEDGDHTRDLTSKIVSAAKQHGATVILSHDAHNASVKGEVRAGFSIIGYHTVLVDGPELGLAYWFKEAVDATE